MIGRVLRRLAMSASLLVAAVPVGAQQLPVAPRQRPRQQVPGAAPGAPGRVALEQLALVVQRRLNLNEQQAARLRATTGRFAAQRQRLMQQERETRRALRLATQAAQGGDSTSQAQVAQQLDALVRMQQRRVELVADEQRELATFLTPLQRSQFLAMQERAFRAAQQLRQKRAAALRDSLLP